MKPTLINKLKLNFHCKKTLLNGILLGKIVHFPCYCYDVSKCTGDIGTEERKQLTDIYCHECNYGKMENKL